MNFELLEKELLQAFVKVLEMKDYDVAIALNNANGIIKRYKKNNNTDRIVYGYKQALKAMESCDYLYWEKKRIKELLGIN